MFDPWKVFSTCWLLTWLWPFCVGSRSYVFSHVSPGAEQDQGVRACCPWWRPKKMHDLIPGNGEKLCLYLSRWMSIEGSGEESRGREGAAF